MSDRLDQLDYYTLLNIPDDAEPDAIREAFHEFALRYHPDRHVGSPEDKIERANDIYRRGAEAYRVLTDPRLRAEYDAGLEEGRLRLGPEATVAQAGKERAPASVPIARQARAYVEKAQAAIDKGDLATARLNLQIALKHDRDSESIKALLAKVESRMSRK